MHEGLILSYLNLYTDICLDSRAKKDRNLNNLNLNEFLILTSEISEDAAPFLKLKSHKDMGKYI